MNAIVLTDQRWAIGLDGGPLFSLEADRKRSGELTEGGTVIVGHRNLLFPGRPAAAWKEEHHYHAQCRAEDRRLRDCPES